MAHFVTAGAIDLKLCTYVPLGKSNSQAKFRSSLILYLQKIIEIDHEILEFGNIIEIGPPPNNMK
jgi:hypothetical protein